MLQNCLRFLVPHFGNLKPASLTPGQFMARNIRESTYKSSAFDQWRTGSLVLHPGPATESHTEALGLANLTPTGRFHVECPLLGQAVIQALSLCAKRAVEDDPGFGELRSRATPRSSRQQIISGPDPATRSCRFPWKSPGILEFSQATHQVTLGPACRYSSAVQLGPVYVLT
jgi:hypothetical protein